MTHPMRMGTHRVGPPARELKREWLQILVRGVLRLLSNDRLHVPVLRMPRTYCMQCWGQTPYWM